MLLTPVAFVLVGFVACIVALTGAYGVHRSVEKLAARRID